MEEIYSTGSGFKCIPNFSSSQFKASGLFKSSSKRTVALKQNSFFVFTWTVFLCRAVEEGYKSILWRLLSWKLLTSFDQLWLLKPFTVFSSSSKWVFTPKVLQICIRTMLERDLATITMAFFSVICVLLFSPYMSLQDVNMFSTSSTSLSIRARRRASG